MMILRIALFSTFIGKGAATAQTVAITDATTYNIGEAVRVRLDSGGPAKVSIRYAGETQPLTNPVQINGSAYQEVWTECRTRQDVTRTATP